MRALALVTLLVACTDDTYLVVTVDKRPAVHEATKLKVTLSNAGSMRTDDLDLSGHSFPVTFSLTAPGRGGELGISVDALDSNSALVGRGFGQATLSDSTATVTLDSADFVVNTDVANNQFLTSDYETNGLQLAAITNGTWMAAYRDDCTNCDIYGRRFDPTGQPVTSTLSASTNAFKVTTTLTSSTAMPVIAANGMNTVVLWDFFDTVGSRQGIACRVINDQGGSSTSQNAIALESADVVTAAPMPNGNFAVTWQNVDASFMQVIRTQVVRPDCTAVSGTPTTVSVTTQTTTGQALDHHRSHVAARAGENFFVWIANDGVRARRSTALGFSASDYVLVANTTLYTAEFVRVVPWGAAYAVAVRWSSASNKPTDPGKIEVYRATSAGVQGAPILITDQSRSDFTSDESFALAAGTDGSLMVAWQVCDTGPGSCEVYGRALDAEGTPTSEPFVIPTSTASDQTKPSLAALPDGAYVAAWNDSSGLDPDRSGSAVRARVIYPPK